MTDQLPRCPECDGEFVEPIWSMRPHTPTEDWYRCDRCGWLFTGRRANYSAPVHDQRQLSGDDPQVLANDEED